MPTNKKLSSHEPSSRTSTLMPTSKKVPSHKESSAMAWQVNRRTVALRPRFQYKKYLSSNQILMKNLQLRAKRHKERKSRNIPHKQN